jgi:hypothetical protein
MKRLTEACSLLTGEKWESLKRRTRRCVTPGLEAGYVGLH